MSDLRTDWQMYVCTSCERVTCCSFFRSSCSECGHQLYPIKVTVLVDVDPD